MTRNANAYERKLREAESYVPSYRSNVALALALEMAKADSGGGYSDSYLREKIAALERETGLKKSRSRHLR
jgi:hypothetical protein